MKIGDRVRDRGTQFVGTIVQLDPPTGVATRARFQADDIKSADRKVGDAPPESMWQRLEEIELIDLQGNPVTGKPGAQIDTDGHRLDSAAHAAGGTGPVDKATGKKLQPGATA